MQGGGCSGGGTCRLLLNADITVTATFISPAPSMFTLAVGVDGLGTGRVTSTPAGIDCGADCVEDHEGGTLVTLTVTPATGSTFLGWSGGGCSGTGTCTVTLTRDTLVVATFALLPDLMTVGVNQSELRTGEQLVASLAINNAGIAIDADFYVGVALPDGDRIVFFVPGGGIVVGRASDILSFVPIATGVSLRTAFSRSVPSFFTHRWTGTEPAGTYVLFLLVTRARGLADGTPDPGDVLGVSTFSFIFRP